VGVTAPPTVTAFAIAAPGLEPTVASELGRLGIVPAVDVGGVRWNGTLESVARANLWLRTASRVVVRMAEFRARTFPELERHARKLLWDRFLPTGTPVRFRVTSRKSRLYHSDAIADRLAAAAAAQTGAARSDDEATAQLFVVRMLRDVCTLSIDSSGPLLHRRGYRQATAKAPLRETIAAAMLLESQWPATVPLIDPMCGAGTIPIEAALFARRIAPGANRRFAFQRWPGFDSSIWARLRDEAKERELPRAPIRIKGSDRDAGAIEAAKANADRAGVASDVEFERRSVSAIEPLPSAGWVVVNPPYGVRVSSADSVRDLYAALGNVLRTRFSGWRLAMLSPSESLERQIGMPVDERFATLNGGLRVRLVTGEVRA
jgi:putative N6-adenine-specific DNA methylase